METKKVLYIFSNAVHFADGRIFFMQAAGTGGRGGSRLAAAGS
ncbi:MAG: hypothetical protein ACQEP5_05820 [Actinomycetota bacterium]